MVCGKCEAKLSRGACPDVWKDGSRNAGAGRDGGRSVAKNTSLKVGYKAGMKTCRLCKSKLSQDAEYCNQVHA
jgi:ribosomal protein L40E